MDLRDFLPDTRPLFEKFLKQTPRGLSAYSFITHFLWRDHFTFRWSLYREHFLLFAEYDQCVYMPLPPMGPADHQVIAACFGWMDQVNPTSVISRIENIPLSERSFYQDCGFVVNRKDSEYFYRRKDLAELKGDPYKTQRWSCNTFEKTSRPLFRPYTSEDQGQCRSLYERWSSGRIQKYSDTIYRFMLHDSETVHHRALAEGKALGLSGWVVESFDRVVGYTFGFSQNEETFCVVLEVADTALTGAAPYLSRAVCKALAGTPWINAMDDSGLENLKRAKASFHPAKMVASYLARHG